VRAVCVGLFPVFERLFPVFVGLFLVFVGLFPVFVGLFPGLLPVFVGLFPVFVGLCSLFVWLILVFVGLFPVLVSFETFYYTYPPLHCNTLQLFVNDFFPVFLTHYSSIVRAFFAVFVGIFSVKAGHF